MAFWYRLEEIDEVLRQCFQKDHIKLPTLVDLARNVVRHQRWGSLALALSLAEADRLWTYLDKSPFYASWRTRHLPSKADINMLNKALDNESGAGCKDFSTALSGLAVKLIHFNRGFAMDLDGDVQRNHAEYHDAVADKLR